MAEVRADAQAGALQRLEPWLDEEEKALVRRGRNCAGRGPCSADAATYGQATGFETMLAGCFCTIQTALRSSWISWKAPNNRRNNASKPHESSF